MASYELTHMSSRHSTAAKTTRRGLRRALSDIECCVTLTGSIVNPRIQKKF